MITDVQHAEQSAGWQEFSIVDFDIEVATVQRAHLRFARSARACGRERPPRLLRGQPLLQARSNVKGELGLRQQQADIQQVAWPAPRPAEVRHRFEGDSSAASSTSTVSTVGAYRPAPDRAVPCRFVHHGRGFACVLAALKQRRPWRSRPGCRRSSRSIAIAGVAAIGDEHRYLAQLRMSEPCDLDFIRRNEDADNRHARMRSCRASCVSISTRRRARRSRRGR